MQRFILYICTGNDYLYPSDLLTVIGTEEQISSFTKIMEIQQDTDESQIKKQNVELLSFVVKADSSVLGKSLAQLNCRDSGCMIIEIDRGKDVFINPDLSFVFEENDLVWIAGDKGKIQQFL